MRRRPRLSARILTVCQVLFVLATLSALPVCGQQSSTLSASTQAPLTLTLQDALARARNNSVQFQAALTDRGVAHQDQVQARAALLPSVAYNNQAIATQNNAAASPAFIAANGSREYVSQ